MPRHGSVRVAAEEALTWAGTCKPGDGLGIAGDEVVIVGDDVVAAGAGLIDLLLAAGGELVTVLTGDGVVPESGRRSSTTCTTTTSAPRSSPSTPATTATRC